MPTFPEPQSRNEAILQNALGANNDTGDPQSRIEELLIELVEAIQQGGSGSDQNAVHYTEDSGKTDEEKAQARENIGALGTSDLGTVFTFKGSKATYADLLLVDDPQIGDVWFVDADSANYVWIEDEANPDGFWDEFGQPINLSAYEEKPTTSTQAGSSVTIASVSLLKYLSNFLKRSSTASFNPAVNSMFFPVIVVFMMSTTFAKYLKNCETD